jgi:hypothetical protein
MLDTMQNRSNRKRRELVGYCNICNQYEKLTEDHVPPKGSIQVQPVEIRNFIDRLGQVSNVPVDESIRESFGSKLLISQNGIKFKTICAHCNNALLGKRYDPEIKRISDEVSRYVRGRFLTGLSLPSKIRVTIKTHKLMRGIIGHLLAAHKSRDQTKPLSGFEDGFYREMRDYFLDEDLPLPPTIEFYYWTYPYQQQVISKGLCVGLSSSGAILLGDLIKFFPLAYFVVYRKLSNLELTAPKILGDGCNDMECEIPLQISLNDVPPSNWPEIPHYNFRGGDPSDFFVVMPYELSIYANKKSS